MNLEDLTTEELQQLGISEDTVVEPDTFDLFGSTGTEGLFDAVPVIMVIFAILFVLFLGFIIFVMIRNYKASKNAGRDFFTLETDLATRALNSQILAPQKSLEQKLRELDDLYARKVITHEEFTAARSKALSE